jgi:signal transduction histidine kinase
MASPTQLRLFRTTAFKLSAIYLAVFTIFAAFLIGYIARNTTDILQAQMRDAIQTEMAGIAGQYARGGLPLLAHFVDVRSRQPGASLYLLTTPTGDKIAGNVESVPPGVLDGDDADPKVVPYLRLGEENARSRYAALVSVTKLPDGERILVGRDVSESEALIGVVRKSLILTVALMIGLGLISWMFVSNRVLKRIDAIAATSRTIIAGNLSERLAVTGTGDEFDRLAESLNTMLSRIERLMSGLKQVSDNIAHDLKTPLTRMRNRVERTLAEAKGDRAYREALQATIEEADQLIRTFNALLMIARVEAGSSDAEFGVFDASEAARDVFELYEPVAEDAGVKLELQAPHPVMLRANRELISQALANLVDNAIKYAGEASPEPRVTLRVEEAADGARLAVVDNGGGISEDDRERVKERFVRLEESRSKPGAGLGLSLVSAVAQLHNGRLVLGDNAPGLTATLQVPGSALERAA